MCNTSFNRILNFIYFFFSVYGTEHAFQTKHNLFYTHKEYDKVNTYAASIGRNTKVYIVLAQALNILFHR